MLFIDGAGVRFRFVIAEAVLKIVFDSWIDDIHVISKKVETNEKKVV